jgi:hypothetical protein
MTDVDGLVGCSHGHSKTVDSSICPVCAAVHDMHCDCSLSRLRKRQLHRYIHAYSNW